MHKDDVLCGSTRPVLVETLQYGQSTMKRGSIDWSLSDTNRRPVTHDTRSQTVSILQIQQTCIEIQVFTWHPLRRFFFNESGVISPSCRDFSRYCLHDLVLIEQAVSRLFSIYKHCGKGNCEKVTVGSRGGPGMAAIFGPGGPIILPWTVWGDCFQGGTVHGVTPPLPHNKPQGLQKTEYINSS